MKHSTRHPLSVALLLCIAAAALPTQTFAQAASQPTGQAAGQSNATGDLERAYRRELAFLEAEKSALEQRIAELDRQAASKTAAARNEVDALRGGALSASLEADRLTDTLLDVERKVEGLQEGDDVLGNVLLQATGTLEKGNIKLPAIDPAIAQDSEAAARAKLGQLDFAFTQAVSLLQRFGSVRSEDGNFFGADGTKVQGTIVRVGNVAAYGVSDRASGVLAPAGDAELKVLPDQETASTAKALAGGQRTPLLQIFLFESLDKAFEAKGKVTPVQHITSGGLIAWVIVGGGILALLMILVRAFLLWRAAANTEKLVDVISPLVSKGNITSAVELCRAAKSASGRVLAATLKHIDRPREQLEDIISEAVLHEQPVLDRFGSSIMVLAAVAPLMGLLGTVTGMISTFDVITEFGTGNPKLLSGGISEALITTELGLIVAIPALLCGNMLSGWADNIKDSMDKSALRITNLATGTRASTVPPAPEAATTSREMATAT